LLANNSSKAVLHVLVGSAINLAMLITYFIMTQSQPAQRTWSNNWDGNILEMAFLAANLSEFNTESDVLLEPSPSDIQRRRAAISDIMPTLSRIIFFEISRGCLGAADYEPVAVDRLCPLAGYKKAVVLRLTLNGFFAFVGLAFVVDLDIEAVLHHQQSQANWAELRYSPWNY
jgi:hypothetical protein